MKRMWSKNELKNIADNQAKAVKKDIATLVDAQGHDRFIEGDIVAETIEGYTQTYGKWSLSGTHLMIVIAGAIAVGSYTAQVIAKTTLPKWIHDKIFTLWTSIVEFQIFTIRDSGGSSGTLSVALRKDNDNVLSLVFLTSQTISTADKNFRIEFDLLIDN